MKSLGIKRLCIDCDNTLRGRIDKKFCNDHCRSNFNNKKRAEAERIVRFVNLTLKKNRNILEKIALDGKAKTNKISLLTAGFDLRFHTHTSQHENGDAFIFCYEYGYRVLESEEFLLVKNIIR